jgi:PIN domain nuclease of toxin-antitoxin system
MLLLDSQALLWMLDDSPRLGPQARQASGVCRLQRVSIAARLLGRGVEFVP